MKLVDVRSIVCRWLVLVALILSGSQFAEADLILTPDAIARGYELNLFANGFPTLPLGDGTSIGPAGIEFTDAGGVLVSDVQGNVRLFPSRANGQNAASAPVGQNYGAFGGTANGIARVGNNYYMAQYPFNDVIQINANGTFNQVIVTGINHAADLVANPTNGHLFASSFDQGIVWDIDPIGKSAAPFVNSAAAGLATDGTTLYMMENFQILGYRISDKQLVFQSDPLNLGSAIALGQGAMAGNIYATNLGGDLMEVSLSSGDVTVIGTGGSRGLFGKVDPFDRTLLFTQTDNIVRLSSNPVPEPASLTLFSLGAIGLMGVARRRRKMV